MTFLNPVKVAGIGQADVKIAYLKVLMNAYNMRIKCAPAVHEPTKSEFKRMAVQMGYVPVVHGQWILRHIGAGHYWECSVCHTNPCIYVTEHTKFCPNCGARMDEGED